MAGKDNFEKLSFCFFCLEIEIEILEYQNRIVYNSGYYVVVLISLLSPVPPLVPPSYFKFSSMVAPAPARSQ